MFWLITLWVISNWNFSILRNWNYLIWLLESIISLDEHANQCMNYLTHSILTKTHQLIDQFNWKFGVILAKKEPPILGLVWVVDPDFLCVLGQMFYKLICVFCYSNVCEYKPSKYKSIRPKISPEFDEKVVNEKWGSSWTYVIRFRSF